MAAFRQAFQKAVFPLLLGRSETIGEIVWRPSDRAAPAATASTESLPPLIRATPIDCFYEAFYLTLGLLRIVSGNDRHPVETRAALPTQDGGCLAQWLSWVSRLPGQATQRSTLNSMTE